MDASFKLDQAKVEEDLHAHGLAGDNRSHFSSNWVVFSSSDNDSKADHSPNKRQTNECLNLSNRQMNRFPDSFAITPSVLVSLSLSNNLLEMIPDSMSGFINLEVLDLHSNHLNLLPTCIGMLTKLKLLNVSKNHLKNFPESIGNCSELFELDASFNQLEILPANFGSTFVKLEKLFLQLNRLTALPASVCEMKSLKHLEVQFNKLTSLPGSLGNLMNLENLNASSNFSSLANLPDSIGDLVSLTSLDLSFNQIRQLPASFGKLQQLETLKLEGNPLIVPPVDVVEHSNEAVLKYMAEQWKSYLVTWRESKTSPSFTAKPIERKLSAYNVKSKSDLSKPSTKNSWVSGMLHGIGGIPSKLKSLKEKSLGWRDHSSEKYFQFSET